jgi:hypothetical protein
MMEEGRILGFTIDQPFDVALRMLRRALAMESLRVPCELDTSARVKQELGVGLKQNIILFVDDPIRLLEATVMDPAGGLFIPKAVVLSSNGPESRVSVRSLDPVFMAGLPVSFRAAVTNLHERILSAIQRVGQKETATRQMAERQAVAV